MKVINRPHHTEYHPETSSEVDELRKQHPHAFPCQYVCVSKPHMRLVKLKEDDERFNLKAGDLLEVEPYWLDPSDKFTVIRRVSDGYDPSCNVYRSQVTEATSGVKHD